MYDFLFDGTIMISYVSPFPKYWGKKVNDNDLELWKGSRSDVNMPIESQFVTCYFTAMVMFAIFVIFKVYYIQHYSIYTVF